MFMNFGPSVVLPIVAMMALTTSVASADPASPTTRPASPDRFHYAGDVLDDRGTPIANATVTATIRERDSEAYIDEVTTDAAGHFAIDRAVAMSGQPRTSLAPDAIVCLACSDAEHLPARRDDLAQLPADALDALRVRMNDGQSQIGRVVDAAGKPVSDALVRVTIEKDWLAGKGAITDADGRFTIRGLPAMPEVISALAQQPGGSLAAAAISLPAPTADGGLVLGVRAVPVGSADVRDVLGMKLASLDAATADALGRHGDGGLLVLDPGANVARLHVGDLQAGDIFWIVGDRPVRTIDDFRHELLAAKQPAAGAGVATCRVVYRFRRVAFDGTNTQTMSLSADDLAALQADSTPQK